MNEQTAVAIVMTLCELLGNEVSVTQAEQTYRRNLEKLSSRRLRPDEYGEGD